MHVIFGNRQYYPLAMAVIKLLWYVLAVGTVDGGSINNINCFKCVYFSITWDPKFPKACRFFGFKSAGMPSATVFNSTGGECVAFEKKGSPSR